ELAQLVEDVRSIGRADIGDVRQCLWAVLQRHAAYHIGGKGVALGQDRQAAFQTRQGIPTASYLQGQRTAFAVATQVRRGNQATVFMAGPAQDVGQFHGIRAEGTDDQKLFTNGRGGHATFLKR